MTTLAPRERLICFFGDQLSHAYADALGLDPACDRVLMIESRQLASRKPYHAKKLTLIWSAMRHFARELEERGVQVIYVRADDEEAAEDFFARIAREAGTRTVACVTPRDPGFASSLRGAMEPAGVTLQMLPDPFWYTQPDGFTAFQEKQPRALLEDYHRAVRRRYGILMDAKGKPEGGEWNYDKQNRKPFPKTHTPRPPLKFEPDALTREVIGFVQSLPPAYGTAANFGYPVCRQDAERLLSYFISELLPNFGPYEDAMHDEDAAGYHSLLSSSLNLSLLSPQEIVDAAIAAYRRGDAPLNSVEGFVRQIVGWREFMFHKFTQFPGDSEGRGYHDVNALDATRPLPTWFWTGNVQARCLRHAISRVLDDAHCHHIERLMVIGNFNLLYGGDPHQLNDWFWSLYIDAYEWVVTPNVVGMSQFADGGWIASKPYIASGAYINKQSNYCPSCVYDPKEATGDNACPFTTLYWAFLIENEAEPLSARMTQNLFGLARKDQTERAAIVARKQIMLQMAEQL